MRVEQRHRIGHGGGIAHILAHPSPCAFLVHHSYHFKQGVSFWFFSKAAPHTAPESACRHGNRGKEENTLSLWKAGLGVVFSLISDSPLLSTNKLAMKSEKVTWYVHQGVAGWQEFILPCTCHRTQCLGGKFLPCLGIHTTEFDFISLSDCIPAVILAFASTVRTMCRPRPRLEMPILDP